MRFNVVDLRKRATGGSSRGSARLPLRETPKRETLRTKRRRQRLIGLAIVAVLFLGFGYGLSYASYLPQFTVQSIKIEGVKALSEEALRVHVEGIIFDDTRRLFSRANVFLYPKKEIETSLTQTFPRIEKVTMSRESLLGTVVLVSIQEREPYARWCSEPEGACYAMDANGYMFAVAEPTSAEFASPYKFYGQLSTTSQSIVGQTYLPGTLSSLLALLDRLTQGGFAPREISTEEGDFFITLAQGFELRAPHGVNIAELVHDLDLILSSDSLRDKQHQLEYVDLRFGNRVYYKLKGKMAVEPD